MTMPDYHTDNTRLRQLRNRRLARLLNIIVLPILAGATVCALAAGMRLEAWVFGIPALYVLVNTLLLWREG